MKSVANTPTDPIFSDCRLAQIYDDFDSDRSDLPPYLSIVKELGAKRVIDLGCGTGVLALMLAEQGVSVIGMDPAEASIRVAESKPRSAGVQWVVGDAYALPTNSVDMIVMTGNVAQAIVEDEVWATTLDRSAHALTPGGYLVFETRKPEYEAWEEWNKEKSFRSIEIEGVGRVDGWVELTKLDLPIVSFRWTYYFHNNDLTITSDSTIRFRTTSELTHDLGTYGFILDEIREAPDRPNKELVIIAHISK